MTNLIQNPFSALSVGLRGNIFLGLSKSDLSALKNVCNYSEKRINSETFCKMLSRKDV